MRKYIEIVVEGEAGEEETRWDAFKRKTKEKAHNAKDWACRNADRLCMAAPATAIIVGKVCNTIDRGVRAKQRQDLRKAAVYDCSERHHWFLKRKLSNAEWAEVQKRRKRGERLGDILESMRVLK